ncbi:MAG: hypothetical protein JWR77_1390 [Rhizorhabdus sp.]|nr:hypothetical protein [Rhizorhabdus sp.]
MESGGITVCAIVKDERRYLIEWVAYYRLLGFDRLVLYSNDCSDGTDRLLDAMQAAGLIEHRSWPSQPGRAPQRSSYEDALGRCDTRWILFVDADEFLRLIEDQEIHQFIARFEPDVSAVAINWRIFGSSGLTDYEPAPVMERFTRSAPRDHPINRHVKTMAVAADVAAVPNAHGVILARGRYVMPNGVDITLDRDAFARPRYRIAQINHYVVKSRAEFEEKRRRGNVTLPLELRDESTMRDQAFFEIHDRNEEDFREILVRLGEVKAGMRRIRRTVLAVDPQLQSLLRADHRRGRLRYLARRASNWLRRRAWRRPAQV